MYGEEYNYLENSMKGNYADFDDYLTDEIDENPLIKENFTEFQTQEEDHESEVKEPIESDSESLISSTDPIIELPEVTISAGKPKVDSEAKGKHHTQIGEKKSKSGAGEYPKRRTVDKDGNTRKEIDYTDHNRPKEHPNPHKHDWPKNNKGQKERSKPKKL